MIKQALRAVEKKTNLLPDICITTSLKSHLYHQILYHILSMSERPSLLVHRQYIQVRVGKRLPVSLSVEIFRHVY